MGLFSIFKSSPAKENQEKHLLYNDEMFAALPNSIAEIRKLMQEADDSAAPAIARKEDGTYEFNCYIYKKCRMKKADEYHDDARRTCLYKIYCLGRTRFIERSTDDNDADGEWSTAQFIRDILVLGSGDLPVGSEKDKENIYAFYRDFNYVQGQIYMSAFEQKKSTGTFELPEAVDDVLDEVDENQIFWEHFVLNVFYGAGRYDPDVRTTIIAQFPSVLMKAEIIDDHVGDLWNAYFEACPRKENMKIVVNNYRNSSSARKVDVVCVVNKYQSFCSMNIDELGKSKETDLQIYKEAADKGNKYALFLYGKLSGEGPNQDMELCRSCMESASPYIHDAQIWLLDYWNDIKQNGPSSQRKKAEKMYDELMVKFFEETNKAAGKAKTEYEKCKTVEL